MSRRKGASFLGRFGAVLLALSLGLPSGTALAANTTRGTHVPIANADPCSVTLLRLDFASSYHYSSNLVGCQFSDKTEIEGDFYIKGDSSSGPEGYNDRAVIDIEPDVFHGSSLWSGWESRNPTKGGPTINGLPSLWLYGSILATPYGKTTDVVVTMYANSSGGYKSGETWARQLALVTEKQLFR